MKIISEIGLKWEGHQSQLNFLLLLGCSLDIAWEAAGFEDNQLPDGQIAEHALGVLDELKENRTEHGETRPFFLAVGFHKPVRFRCMSVKPGGYVLLVKLVANLRAAALFMLCWLMETGL